MKNHLLLQTLYVVKLTFTIQIQSHLIFKQHSGALKYKDMFQVFGTCKLFTNYVYEIKNSLNSQKIDLSTLALSGSKVKREDTSVNF